MTKEVKQPADNSLDVESGAQALLGLLSDDLEIQAVDAGESDDSDTEDVEESDVDDDFEDADDADDEDDTDDEGDADDEDDSDDEATDDGDSTAETYKVKVDGQEIEVTLQEALAGYQRQQAFTRRTQQLAEERKALRAEAEGVAQARQDYLDRLDVVKAALSGATSQPDWAKLKESDPDQYAKLRVAFQERQEQIAQVEAEIQRVRDEQRAAFESQREALVAAEAEKLEAAIPEWATDPEQAKDEKQRIANFAMQTYGFSADDVGNVVDSRLVLLLRDAMQFHDLQTKGKRVKEEIRGKRRKSPTLHPGSRDARKAGKSKKNPARHRLAKTGSVDDAAAAFLAMDFD